MHPSFRFFLALLGLSGVHRNSTWQLTQSVSYCGIRTADGRKLPPILRCSARQMGTQNTTRLQPFANWRKRIWFLNRPNFYYVSLARIIPFHHAE